MGGKDSRRIAADAEERGMAERDQPAQAERKVQADRRKRQDGHARRQRDVEGLIQRPGGQRHEQQQSRQQAIDQGFAPHPPHALAANRPRGRKARISAMTPGPMAFTLTTSWL